LLEAKWTELPSETDVVNLDHVRRVEGKSKTVRGAVVARTPHGYPLPKGFRAQPVSDFG
jgi:hypothetical protein